MTYDTGVGKIQRSPPSPPTQHTINCQVFVYQFVYQWVGVRKQDTEPPPPPPPSTHNVQLLSDVCVSVGGCVCV